MILNHPTNPHGEAGHSPRALEINEITKVYGRRAVVHEGGVGCLWWTPNLSCCQYSSIESLFIGHR